MAEVPSDVTTSQFATNVREFTEGKHQTRTCIPNGLIFKILKTFFISKFPLEKQTPVSFTGSPIDFRVSGSGSLGAIQ